MYKVSQCLPTLTAPSQITSKNDLRLIGTTNHPEQNALFRFHIRLVRRLRGRRPHGSTLLVSILSIVLWEAVGSVIQGVNVRDADPDGLVAYPDYRRDVGEKRNASQDELVAYPDYRRDTNGKREAEG